MTSQELADNLMKIYVRGQTFNTTSRTIIHFLHLDRPDEAYSEYLNNGDKIPKYSEWGREFESLLYNEFGCRLHRIKKCDGWICKYVD